MVSTLPEICVLNNIQWKCIFTNDNIKYLIWKKWVLSFVGVDELKLGCTKSTQWNDNKQSLLTASRKH